MMRHAKKMHQKNFGKWSKKVELTVKKLPKAERLMSKPYIQNLLHPHFLKLPEH